MSALDSAGISAAAIPHSGGEEQSISIMRFLGARWPQGCNALSKFCGQATKGAWWMPWQKQAMKDVASCDKLRGAASRH